MQSSGVSQPDTAPVSPEVPSTRPGRTSLEGWNRGLPVWVGRIVTLGGVWSLLSLVLHQWRWPRAIDMVFAIVGVPVAPSLFVAALLMVLGGALRRRMRAAWISAAVLEALIAFVAGAGFLYNIKHFDDLAVIGHQADRLHLIPLAVTSVVSLIVLVGLWLVRRYFTARLRRGSVQMAVIVLVVGLILATAITFGLISVFPGEITGIENRLIFSVRVTIGFNRLSRPVADGIYGPHWIAVVSGGLATIALMAAIGAFLRSARRREFLSAQDELTLRGLLARHGERDSLGYFATRRDKSVVFGPDHGAAVTYRTVYSVSLASGDPIGAVHLWPAAIDRWIAEAHEHGWFPAVVGATEEGARAYVDAGLKAIPLGDEAVVDADEFRIDDRSMRPVKRGMVRVREAGYTLTVRHHDEIPAEEMAEIEQLAEAWRGDEPDRGFAMALNRLGERVDGRCVMVVARDGEGRIRGLQSYVPWGIRGLSLDLMRRDRTAVNGTTEALVCALMAAAPDLGIRRVSLNFAVFRSVFSSAEAIGAGPLVRLREAVLSFASRFWQIESLYRSNAKYLPEWTPRYLCFDSNLTLLRVGLAAGTAEGFLPGPALVTSRSDHDTVTFGGERMHFIDAALAQERTALAPARPIRRQTQQQKVRQAKAAVLVEQGIPAYPVEVPRSTSVAAVTATHTGLEAGGRTGETVSITGRVRARRNLGGVLFAVVEENGHTIQALLETGHTPDAERDRWRRTVDIGDRVSVTGEVGASDRGELSVLVDSWVMAAKCLRPLPDARAGFSDPDARVRQRYLDLIVNRDSMEMLHARSRAVAAIRRSFMDRGFLEVETPMLQAVHGGATARPFRTHINAYDMDLYLRIAPELSLKNLCVGGMGRIFELNRNFRNEGADATHNPEFTSVEAYEAYGDYNSMRELTRSLIIEVATAVHGEPVAIRPTADGRGTERVRIDGNWPVVTVHHAVSAATGTSLTSTSSLEEVREVCRLHGVHAPSALTAGELVMELYEALVEKQTTMPTFYTDFPLETSPLTREHRDDPRLSERWDLVAWGAELGTAYSELIDPVEQRRRLEAQSLKAAQGDPEAMEVDEAFLTALEYAMPPTGGLGLGVDRLVMMLTGANIRATLAFPFVRPS